LILTIIYGKLLAKGRLVMTHIKFPFDTNKALQAVLWLLCRNNGAMNKLKLVKLVFLADRAHLVKYGRPIVGGNYFAMDHGPVSSELLNTLNAAKTTHSKAPIQAGPAHMIKAAESPDERYLSESDLTTLDDIYRKFGHLDGFTLRDLTHKLKAYKKNTPQKGSRHRLPYEDFFEDYPKSKRAMLKIILDEQQAWADFN
jgi:uncharacterized phage-associated protein